jgi:hypothetical protein
MQKQSVFGDNVLKPQAGPKLVLRAGMGFTPHASTLAVIDTAPPPRMLPELAEGFGESPLPVFRRLNEMA